MRIPSFLVWVALVRSTTEFVALGSPDTTRKLPLAPITNTPGSLPLMFEKVPSGLKSPFEFVAHAREYDLLIRPTDLVIRARGHAYSGQPLRMRLVGANAGARIDAENSIPTKTSYFRGNDPNQWRVGVSNYGRLRVHDAWPGISLTYYGTEGRMEYDIEVAVHARAEQIHFAFEASARFRIASDGALELPAKFGIVRLHAPIAYQVLGGMKVPVAAAYYRVGRRSISIRLGSYDRNRPVIIDPILSYSTYLGPTQGPAVSARGYKVTADAAGNAYVLGYTSSPLFPGANDSLHGSIHGDTDLFVAKLGPDGASLVWAAYVGGNGIDFGEGIAVDASGNVYLAGSTSSLNFPTTAGAYRTTGPMGGQDIFVTVLNSTGSALIYSSYFGGSDTEYGTGLAIGPASIAYVTGSTYSTDFPTTANAFLGPAAYQNSVLIKINPYASGGASLVYSSLLSQSGANSAVSVAVDAGGMAYVAGYTSTTVPLTPTAFQTSVLGFGDIYAMKLNPAETGAAALKYSTLLGGDSNNEVPYSIAVDSLGRMYVAGTTGSFNFPTTAGAFQTSINGGAPGFVAKLNPMLSGANSLLYSTYLGSSFGSTQPFSMALDPNGNVYVGGVTNGGFPTVAGAFQMNFGGGANDGFIAKLSADGTSLIYGTYLGGSSFDEVNGLAAAPGGSVIVTGSTYSRIFHSSER